MITPTRTVCYAIPVDSKERFVVNSVRVNGALIELQQRPMKLHYLRYSEVDRIIVREEPIEQYHPSMFHTSELPALEIKPYPLYDSFLGSLSCLRPIEMPKDSFQKMYLGEWVNEE